MKRNVQFYSCGNCGNIVGLIKNGGGQLYCCGKPMNKIVPNTVEASGEKHLPVAKRKDGKIYVEVGSIAHPMEDKHYIEWIAVITENSTERISLLPSNEPKAVFCDKENAEVYAYCNLHGLWKANVE